MAAFLAACVSTRRCRSHSCTLVTCPSCASTSPHQLATSRSTPSSVSRSPVPLIPGIIAMFFSLSHFVRASLRGPALACSQCSPTASACNRQRRNQGASMHHACCRQAHSQCSADTRLPLASRALSAWCALATPLSLACTAAALSASTRGCASAAGLLS